MKKRRPCTWTQYGSPKTSPRTVHIRASESFPARTKSFHDLKRRRLQRTSSTKLQKRSGGYGDEPFGKRDAFGSLESLFDVKKPLDLPDINSLTSGYVLPDFQVENVGDSKDIEETNPLQHYFEPKLQISEERNFDRNDDSFVNESEKIDDLHEEKQELEIPNVADVNSVVVNPEEELEEKKSSYLKNMSESDEETVTAIIEGEEAELPEDDTSLPADDVRDPSVDDEVTENYVAAVEVQPPSRPLPPGYGTGAPIKPGGNRESQISSTPLTDPVVRDEMLQADERCAELAKEIEQLREEIAELSNKKDLTDEDTVVINEKQESIMIRLAEFEEITRKLQRILGLSDPSSHTFAKMYSMLPYAEGRSDVAIEELIEEPDKDKETAEFDEGIPLKPFIGDGKFDLPQIEYPEDKLPRVIVCGPAEDNIPRIVIADSERKGKKRCLENLTGKLTESLSMQEKLVQENAQLEGGKYKLEEALLEKDSAVESLQRKVCGLQAEMRIVVKENTELTRQLASLNQRITSPPCWCTCPGSTSTNSASASPRALRPYSYTSSVQQEDDSCRCKCCNQSQFAESLSARIDPAYGTASEGPKSPLCGGSPRLAGGASRTEGCCLTSGTSSPTKEMCCRSPAVRAPPPQRGAACPADIENKLAVYGNSTKQLEQQLGNMESEVRSMQLELANVQRERQQLEQQRKLLKCTGPCAPCACNPQTGPSIPPPSYAPPAPPILSTPMPTSVHTMPLSKMMANGSSTCPGPCSTAPMQQLRDLREQYARLQDDYKNKLCEVSVLRADVEKLKHETRDAKEEKDKMEIKMVDAQERLKLLEAEKDKYEGYKEQIMEQEQALQVAKQRFREAQDELEELRSLIQDQATQMEDYRNKYLQAQQQVEEQRRQLDLMEMDNARMNENVTLEIGRVKNQFQEKLAELAPLPDILKQTQVKLQEAQQLRLVAERNCEELSRDLIGCKDKIQTLQNQLDALRKEYQVLQDERGQGTGRFEELERKNAELRHENERMKNTLSRFEEHEAQLQKRIDEKMHEITQLNATLDQVREDSARQVSRTKERCETVRRSMQGQIADMERQVAQCRATARAAQKDRDEIRQKMQGQINNLNEAFEQAQGRIRSLQGHVNYLKTSYSNIFKGQGEPATGVMPGDASGAGYDTCDCNY